MPSRLVARLSHPASSETPDPAFVPSPQLAVPRRFAATRHHVKAWGIAPGNRQSHAGKPRKGVSRGHDPFAPLGLGTFVSQCPWALPWAVTSCAFGTEHMASRPDCASLLWIVITILPEQNPDKSMTLVNPTFALANPILRNTAFQTEPGLDSEETRMPSSLRSKMNRQ